jgi:hypothetical protein
VRVEVARVDVQKRMLDFRLVSDGPPAAKPARRPPEGDAPPSYGQFPKRIKKSGKRRKG